MGRPLHLFWRVLAVNAGLLVAVAILLIASPVEISDPIRPIQVVIVLAGLVITVAANALLLRRVVAPLERLAQRMDMVDLLRPGQRLRSHEVTKVDASCAPSIKCSTGSRTSVGRTVGAYWLRRKPSALALPATCMTRSASCSLVCCSTWTRSQRSGPPRRA